MPDERNDIGAETLRRMSALDHYNDWIAETIRPWVGSHVLEVGSGIGNFSRYFLACERLIVSDIREDYLEHLRSTYGSRPNVAVEYYNLEESAPHLRDRGIDTLVALNVLEHIRNDSHALAEMASLLSPGGRIILQLPAHPLLFGSLDINLAHFRRYTKRDIAGKLAAAGFETERMVRFNLFGALGWFFCSRILRSELLPEGQLGLFNRLTPLFIATERKAPIPFGLSLLVVGRKM
jgi:SAM-dependent methyltransferase